MPNITQRLKQLKLKVLDGYRVRFKPSEDQLKQAREYGMEFAQAVLDNLHPIQRAPKAGKVRCDVCGAVFDADAEVCPVCKVGREHFVPSPGGEGPQRRSWCGARYAARCLSRTRSAAPCAA